MLSLDLSALAIACEALNIEKLTDQDIVFLREYKSILQPIAEAITFVEGNRNMFGALLPTLFGIRLKLRELYQNSDDLKYCKALLDAIRAGFDKRFSHLMKLSDMYDIGDPKAVPLFVAMLSHPNFKMSFIPPYWFDENHYGMNAMRNLMINAMKQIIAEQKQQQQQQQQIENESNETANTSSSSCKFPSFCFDFSQQRLKVN